MGQSRRVHFFLDCPRLIDFEWMSRLNIYIDDRKLSVWWPEPTSSLMSILNYAAELKNSKVCRRGNKLLSAYKELILPSGL